MFCQGLQVLHDGYEVELVACAGEAPQPHTLKTMVGLEVRKAHLDLLALVARFVELGRTHQRTSVVAGVLIEVARDFSLWGIRTALGLDWTCATVA